MLGWSKTSRVHFIGIGGIGMSGIAEVLLDLGYSVSGSDLGSSVLTEKLIRKGATIFSGHQESNVDGADLIVYSSAISFQNPEVVRANELNIPMIKRAEMLAELMRQKFSLAIAGSHGKTTTSGILATIFHEAKKDPSFVIGGIVRNLGGNAYTGDGEYFIAEVDESDGSFLIFNPIMAAVTNIDDDHLDHYGSKENITQAFIEFVNKVPFYGKVALNANDHSTLAIRQQVRRPMIWYGIDLAKEAADYVATNVEVSASGTDFDLIYRGKLISRLKTHLLGLHNVSNALAAISLAHAAGIEWGLIQKGLLSFQGMGRRLEKLFEENSFVVIDDYGHHPTEVRATISSLCSVDKRSLCVVFEPHRYSRTKNFWQEFQDAFDGADEIYITPIYPASETPLEKVTSERLVTEMRSLGKPVMYLESLDGMKELLKNRRNTDCIFLTLGAGPISKKIREMVKDL